MTETRPTRPDRSPDPDAPLRAALRAARSQAGPPPDLAALLARAPRRRRPRAAAVALSLALLAGLAAWPPQRPAPPAAPERYAIELPNYTGALANPFQRRKLRFPTPRKGDLDT